jgi:hypothetical protein
MFTHFLRRMIKQLIVNNDKFSAEGVHAYASALEAD